MRRIKQHTLEKLEYFRKYLEAYLIATKRLPLKYYVDAFAGTGKCVFCDLDCDSEGGLRCEKCGRGEIVDGSALISLKLSNDFNGYYLIELKAENMQSLKKLVELDKSIPSGRSVKVRYHSADSNVLLKNLHKMVDKYTGCMILLDPEGSELFWDTIESLAKIPKADLFILYPYHMSLARLVKDYPEKLDRFYGTPKWREVYGKCTNTADRSEKMLEFYENNLLGLGFKNIESKQIRRKLRQGHPLYHLVLATHSDVAAKIMSQIFNKELDGQTKLC